jgi:phosphatidylserine/phosphatidylglycerophosphate/cardiolipin synthase-like enzyme
MTRPGQILSLRQIIAMAILILVIAAGNVGLYHQYKPLPLGLSFQGNVRSIAIGQAQFLYDLTRHDGGKVLLRQEIFDSVFALIDRAERYILVDMFLMNDDAGKSTRRFRPLSKELADHLINRKKAVPDISIDLITDPINTVYGGAPSPILDRLRQAGINVTVTDLAPLRDSNRLYSPFWRFFTAWMKNTPHGGLLPHPFSSTGPRVTLRSYLALLNFKANHRKVILTEAKGTLHAIVASANAHDASAEHSNTALKVSGTVCNDIYRCEAAVARLSGGSLSGLPDVADLRKNIAASGSATIYTEGAIRTALLERLTTAPPGSELFIALFYLSDRAVIKALGTAARQGIPVTIVLDRNKSAFGYTKRGIPNLPVADELKKTGCTVRFYRTGDEQFHTKLALIDYAADSIWCMTGSANYTRRNIGNLNLELTCAISDKKSTPFAKSVLAYRNLLTADPESIPYTVAISDTGVPLSTRFMYGRYRFFEATGFSSF